MISSDVVKWLSLVAPTSSFKYFGSNAIYNSTLLPQAHNANLDDRENENKKKLTITKPIFILLHFQDNKVSLLLLLLLYFQNIIIHKEHSRIHSQQGMPKFAKFKLRKILVEK